MGYLRKNSFLIFEDKNAPTEAKGPDLQKIAEIEAVHQEAKKARVDARVWKELGLDVPRTLAEELAAVGVNVTGLDQEELARIARQRDIFDWEVTAEDAEAAKEVARKEEAGGDGQRLRQIVQIVQDFGADEKALNEYLRTTFRQSSEKPWRDFGRSVFTIANSKPALPDTRYVPIRNPDATVRFKGGGYLGTHQTADPVRWDSERREFVARTESELMKAEGVTLWVKVVDGWEKNGNWGGHLQVTCATGKGNWIESRDGWVGHLPSKGDPVSFYDMGNYYEIWQKTRETGRPLVVEGSQLRFSDDKSNPGKFNIENSAWD
ncbi:hypothetical protein [Streptomyces sp. NPDC002209]|uniref:hypothetical protein n=1 Tax=Streptomyces sp. NPDC002209 TaxID=3364638 RepID=UPI00368B72BE